MAKELAYSVLDVFAERALEGNPLAVFHDARGLSSAEMQALARETNLSETTFVLPGDAEEDRRLGVHVRIFTTQSELPFAGHPTLGTASWLRLHYPPVRAAETVTLRLQVGPIPVRFRSEDAGPGVYGTMQQNDPEFGEEFDAAEVAAVLGVGADALMAGRAPQKVSTGNPFCIVALRSLEELAQLAIPQRESNAWLSARGIRWFYCIAPTGRTDAAWRARMQWSGGEDPATGSAAGPCIAWLVRHGLAAAGAETVIEQGVEMQRPSRIVTAASIREGKGVGSIMVGGRTIPVAQGRFFLP